MSCGTPFVFTMPPKQNKKGKRKNCSSGSRKKNPCDTNGGGSSYCNGYSNGEKKRNFMEDVWKVMTPDMLEKLVDILVEDFQMTRADACNFIQQQRDTSKAAQKNSGKCPCIPDTVPAIPNLDVRNAIIKEFIDLISCKLSDYMAMMLCTRRSHRQEVLAKTMVESLNEFIGCGGDQSSALGKFASFIADKLAYWVDSLFEDEICKKPGSDGDKKESVSSSSKADAPPPPPPPPPTEAEPPPEE